MLMPPLDRWSPVLGQALPFILLTGLLLLVWRLLAGTRRTPLAALREIIFLVAAGLLYSLVRGVVADRALEAAARASRLMHFERVIGIFWEPHIQDAVLRYDLLVTAANWVYIWWHWPLIAGVMIWLFVRHRDSYPLYRNALLISGAIGLAIFALFPVAPPRLMPGLGFVDTITANSHAYRLLQPPALTNQYAALPSFHFGWNLLMGIAVIRQCRGRLPKLLGLAAPPIMFLSIVFTGNHYIVDAVAGAIIVLVGLLFAREHNSWMERLSSGRLSLASVPTRPTGEGDDRER